VGGVVLDSVQRFVEMNTSYRVYAGRVAALVVVRLRMMPLPLPL